MAFSDKLIEGKGGAASAALVIAALAVVGMAGLSYRGASLGMPAESMTMLVLGLAGVAITMLVVGLLAVSAAARRAALGTPTMASSSGSDQRTQEAILRLLDEMSSLADGDLTVEATVTEDITGAIADSVNYTIEALRELVSTIRDTAEQVASASGDTVSTTQELAIASEKQSEQIAATTDAIQRLVGSLQQVAENSKQAEAVAVRSVDVAHNGGEAVRRTIQGMDSIREQIQETSKRIKRLGESSQEIGDIVELINDIAEQTNTLALNASIQAAMAGDAGRGFAVVADEVQRLAERTGNATKRIEALVRTIQADTNEAVISMEKSTSGVVSGAGLAVNAGNALEEIEQVSRQIAELVAGISETTQEQTSRVGGVAKIMTSIRQITERTSMGTRNTGKAVGELAVLAKKLRESVAGFQLPGGGGN